MANSVKQRVLYHFTSILHLPAILTEGLSRGDVPLSPMTGINGVWFSKDPSPEKQRWGHPSPGGEGRLPFVDKTKIRIAIQFAHDTEQLWHWPTLARLLKVREAWYKALEATGGNPLDWYVAFFGIRVPYQCCQIYDGSIGEYRDLNYDERMRIAITLGGSEEVLKLLGFEKEEYFFAWDNMKLVNEAIVAGATHENQSPSQEAVN